MRQYSARIAGDNCLPEHFRMLVSGPTGCGKTTFVENLIKSDRLKVKPSRVYYCYPDDFDEPPVNWHEWNDILVTYVPFMPDIEFFKTIDKGSLVVFDDNFDQAIQNSSVCKAMKIHSRRKFSVILITQMFYEQGKHSRVIRNQLNALVLYRNFGDIQINRNIAIRHGVRKQYLMAEKETWNKKFDPVVILSNEIVDIPELRVQTSYLNKYVQCYM